MNQLKPNFFIVGGPKCGTSSLFEYLEEHPEVCMSFPKEPHYFLSDLPNYRQAKTLEQYINMFDFKNYNNPKIIGEGSTWYLFSEAAIKNIIEYNPDSRIIVMIRNPLQVVVSLYWQFVYGHEENAKSFHDAWVLQDKRKQGQEIPTIIDEPSRLQYAEVAAFGTQLERVLNIIPNEQLKVILFDDFVSDTRGVYKEVLDFLGLADDDKKDFHRSNERKAHKSKLLALLTRPSQRLTKLVKFVKGILGIKSIGLFQKIDSINTQKIKREALSYSLAKEMHEVFDPEIVKLEKLLNVDLGLWKKYGLENNKP